MRHKCMKWFSTFSQHKRNFNNISFLHNFAHNHADMIMCIDNDYLLIFSMLFFESANVIDAVCIFLRKYLKNMHYMNLILYLCTRKQL